jgi:hypothetical protein
MGVGLLAARADPAQRRRHTLRVGSRAELGRVHCAGEPVESSENGWLFDVVISGPSDSWKCKCGPLEFPELPSLPITWPFFTSSPVLTVMLPGCRCA